MAKRLALLIGNKTFDHKNTFPNLRTPIDDVRNLARVLQEHSDFEILAALMDANVETINRAIDDLFSGVERGDLVLLYYSGHGYRDRNGQHYLIAKNSRPNRLRSTAISGTFIHDVMSDSRSRHQIIILDCCFSGAFIKGQKSGAEPLVLEELKGEGRAILASSGKIQYSFEEKGQNSLFTQHLLEGIETGEADEDKDGHISIDELFYYAAKKVRETRPEQTPMIELSVREGEIRIAKNPKIAQAKILPGSEVLWQYSRTTLLIRHLVFRALMVILLGLLLAIPVIVIRLPFVENRGIGYIAFSGLTAALGGSIVNGIAATVVTLLEFKFPHWSHWKQWFLFLPCQLLIGLVLGVLVMLLHSTGWFKLFDEPQQAIGAGLAAGLFAGIALYLSLPAERSQNWWQQLKPSLIVGSTTGLIFAMVIFIAGRSDIINLSSADESLLWLEFVLYGITMTTTFAFGFELGDRLLDRLSPLPQI